MEAWRQRDRRENIHPRGADEGGTEFIGLSTRTSETAEFGPVVFMTGIAHKDHESSIDCVLYPLRVLRLREWPRW